MATELNLVEMRKVVTRTEVYLFPLAEIVCITEILSKIFSHCHSEYFHTVGLYIQSVSTVVGTVQVEVA
jgi:hypothetical protein